MSDGPWNDYSDEATAVAEGPWTRYEEDPLPVPPVLPQTQMAEAANAIPMPGYTTPFGQDINRTAQARVQSQPSPQALMAGAFLNQRTLEPPPPLGMVESGNFEGFGSIANADPQLYRDTLHEAVKQLTPTPETVRSAREFGNVIQSVAFPENPTSLEVAQERLAGPNLPPESIDKAIAGGLGATYRQIESFAQPEQLPLLFAGSVPGKLGQAVTAAFYADMVRHSPEVFNKVVDALQSGDVQQEAEALTDAVIHGAFLGLTGAHTANTVREGVDSFIKNNGPEARRAHYEQMRLAKQKADLAPIAQPESFTQPIKPQENINATLRQRSSEALPIRETPGNSQEVGARIPESKASAETQGGEPSSAQPAEAAPSEISLRPAIRGQGQIVEGTLGKSHGDLITDATKSGDPAKMMAAIAGANEGRGFMDQNGKFYTRKEAEALMREQHGDFEMMKPAEGLHSEDLNAQGQPKTQKAAAVEPAKVAEGVDTSNVKGKLTEEEQKTADKTLPWTDFKEPMPASPHYPIIIETKNGLRYPAYMSDFYDMREVGGKLAPGIAKVVESGPGDIGLSHGILGEGEKIVAGEYPKTPEAYQAAKTAGVKPPRTLGETPKPKTAESPRLMIDPFGVGAARIVAKAAAVPVKNAIIKANRTRKAFGTLFRATANRKLMDQTFDAAENMANIAGQQARKSLDIGTTPIERKAALAVIEANGDPAKLAQFEQQAIAGGNKEAQQVVEYARKNWQGLQDLAARMKGIMDAQVADENSNGISTEYHEAYVPHLYDKDLWMGAGRPFVIGTGSGGGASTGFKKGRTFPTIFDAIEAGYVPESLDVGKLAEHRVKNGQKLINRKQWGESLASVHDPTDNKPLATAMVRKARGPGRPGYEVAPVGYVPREIIPGVRVAIHEGYSSLFDAMTGTSRISGNAAGQMLLQAEGAVKHGLLLFDTFHASRIMQKQLLLTGKFDAGARGHTLLEYADHDLSRAVAANLITPEMAAWVRQNRPVANLLIRNGLNVGRVSEALYTSFIREIPVLGTFNKWVFEKLTRGAILQAGLIEFERISKAMPNLTQKQVALKVSRDLNAYFGNLGRQGLFKSATAQDLARLTFLAPNWVESMARTEIKGALAIGKGLIVDPEIAAKTIMTGSIGKGVAQGLLAYFIGTQLLNLVTRGHPTWQNPEDKHKLDAWIPDLSGKGGHGFFISPFSVVAELTHDMLRYTRTEGTALKAAAKILVNKLSPPGRALKVLLSGKDFDKTQIDSTWGRVKAAAMALAPTPIPLSPLIKGTQYPGQTQRQLTASLGFKTEPAESATQQISDKATEFLKKQGKTKAYTFEPNEDPSYAKLRTILRRGDEAAAVKMLDELQAQHTGKQVLAAMRNHARHPFTGSKTAERTFLNTLSDKDATLYDKAKDEQKAEYDNFLKLWYSRPAAPATTNAPATAGPWLNY